MGEGEKPSDNGHATVELLMGLLREAYKRGPNDRFDYFEEFTISQIAQRPKCLDEMREIIAYRESMKDSRFFPKSVRGLVEAWNKTLDRARQDTLALDMSEKSVSKAEIDARRQREIDELQQIPVAPRNGAL